MISQTQKQAIDFAISLNPTSVAISRVEYVEKDGAREKREESVATQTMLVYPKSPGMKGLNDIGGRNDESDWGALAPSTANVRWGTDITDSFTVPSIGTLEIVSGRPIMIGSDVNGYQLNLRLVK